LGRVYPDNIDLLGHVTLTSTLRVFHVVLLLECDWFDVTIPLLHHDDEICRLRNSHGALFCLETRIEFQLAMLLFSGNIEACLYKAQECRCNPNPMLQHDRAIIEHTKKQCICEFISEWRFRASLFS
jgi:hypothetical protein